jgi:hypothetical protein
MVGLVKEDLHKISYPCLVRRDTEGIEEILGEPLRGLEVSRTDAIEVMLVREGMKVVGDWHQPAGLLILVCRSILKPR